MTTYVLIHGGGHGGWCWQRLARVLRSQGHEVYAPTLTGFGERCHLGEPETPFETFVTDVVQVVEFEDLTDVVLVGHSMGGVVIPRVAQQIPERIRQVIWLAAVVCADGESLLQAVPQTPETAAAVTVLPDGSIRTDQRMIVDAVLSDGTARGQGVGARAAPAVSAGSVDRAGQTLGVSCAGFADRVRDGAARRRGPTRPGRSLRRSPARRREGGPWTAVTTA